LDDQLQPPVTLTMIKSTKFPVDPSACLNVSAKKKGLSRLGIDHWPFKYIAYKDRMILMMNWEVEAD
jgi:hypothetical protein